MSMGKTFRKFVASALLLKATFAPVSYALADEMPSKPVSAGQEQMLRGDCERAINGAIFRRTTERRELMGIYTPRGTALYNGVMATIDALSDEIITFKSLQNDPTSCGPDKRAMTGKIINRAFDGQGYN